MTEKKSGVFELEKEEMARVSGGFPGGNNPVHQPRQDPLLVEQPHCPECGLVVESYSGKFKCITSWCKKKGDIIDPKDLIWK